MNRRDRAALVLLPLLLLAGCATPPGRTPPPGRTTKIATRVRLQGMPRPYRLHVPAALPDAPAPLLVVLHGAFSTAREMERWSGFSTLADRDGFLVAYPEGGFSLFGKLQHWNAGHCCGRAARVNANDGAFLDEVIRDASARHRVDPARVYLAGFSNGGMLVYRYGAERSERLAGMAVVAGAFAGRPDADSPAWKPQPPARPVPLLVLHGDEDRHVPMAGGRSPAKRDSTREYASTAEAVEFWRAANGCANPPKIEPLCGGRVERRLWRAPATGADVALVTLHGWGHAWPGGELTANLPDDSPLKGFDAGPVIWEFLKAHRRDAVPSPAR
jgi:polyhydroxybutyrate depolymerase